MDTRQTTVESLLAIPQVFVADQDSHTRERVHRIFSSAGYFVQEFSDANSLKEKLKENTPDCLLVNTHLPDSEGVDLLRQFRNNNYNFPTIMLTNNGDVPSAVSAIRMGAVDYIEKPFVDRVLFQRVRRAVKRPKNV